VGIYQFVAVGMLAPFGVSKTDAIAYILLFQAMNYAIVLLWGLMGIAAERQPGPEEGRPLAVGPQIESD
jgi:uncharacterized membrane protein YbhN (UPF0104 family)